MREFCRDNLQVLFRGVREMKKMQMQLIRHPKIIIECAGKQSQGESKTIESTTIKDTEVNSNFDDPLKYIDIVSITSLVPGANVQWLFQCLFVCGMGRLVVQ
jgi:hypothetical protein